MSQPDYFKLACDVTRSYTEALMRQPAADVTGDWIAYKQPDGLWTVRNRQTGVRVAVDMAEPDARVCVQAQAMRTALEETAKLWHYDNAAQPGSPCYKLGFSRCEGLRCGTNRAILAATERG